LAATDRDGKAEQAPFDLSDPHRKGTYKTRFTVSEPVKAAALNLSITTEDDKRAQGFGHLLVYLDGQLVFDDMTRHEKPERRLSSIPLTESQSALLAQRGHELKIEVAPKFPISALDVSLDAVQ
jgi:hypothetical protein